MSKKKFCIRCLQSKDREQFHNHSNSPDGKQGWCKECKRASKRLYIARRRG